MNCQITVGIRKPLVARFPRAASGSDSIEATEETTFPFHGRGRRPCDSCVPFSAAVGTFATRGSPGIGITGSPLNTTLDEIYLTDSLDHKV